MVLKYTSVKEFWEFLGINESILSVLSNGSVGSTPARETIAESSVVAGTYYLDQPTCNYDTIILYVGNTSTTLTLTTDYTFDSATSAITITAAGETALSGNSLTGVYEYSTLGNLTYLQTVSLLERMEQRLDNDLQVVFANQSDSNPTYAQITNEFGMGKGHSKNMYYTQKYPVVNLQTTVNGAYTTGGSTITLTDASGFPNTGTIYIGGNKVTYTAKSTNDLTVPSSTSSIADGTIVRGEVIEVSLDPQGVTPTFTVLIPDVDYAFDYDTGNIQLFNEYYQVNLEGLTRPINGIKNRLRYSYMHAWHPVSQVCSIPDEIKELVYMMSGRQLVQRTILKSNVGQRDNFTTDSYGFSKIDIEEIKAKYRAIKVSNV